MSDDSFIREVNEEIRQDRARKVWERFGPTFVAIAVGVVLVTAAYVGYRYWVETRANASGDAFSQALAQANGGRPDEALTALKALEVDGYGAYPLLARMRAATVLAEKGDVAAAVAEFDAVAETGSVPEAIRDLARLRAGYLLVDTGTYEDVSRRVEILTNEGNVLRHSANEALGLAAWKAGRTADALGLFDGIVADETAPRNVRDRATLVSQLIRGSGAAS